LSKAKNNDPTSAPADRGAEQTILGNCLIQESAQPLGELAPEDFYWANNQKVARKIREFEARGEPVTITRVSEHLNGSVSPTYLAELTDGMPVRDDLTYYIKRIRQCAAYRKGAKNCELLQHAYLSGDPERIAEAHELLADSAVPDAVPAISLTRLEFPREAMIGTLGAFAEVMAKGTEVPEEFYFATSLTVFGNMCATRLRITAAVDVETRLYTVLLGETYDVKKSTALRRTVEFFANQWIEGPALIWGVGSAEGLAKQLQKNRQVVLCYDEFRSFLDKTRVQGSVLLPMVTSLFENRVWHNHTKTSSVEVEDAHLSLAACCTLDTYAQVWTPEAIAIGLPNRLFVVSAERKTRVSWPGPADSEKLDAIRQQLRLQLSLLPMTLDITPEAKAEWTAWYEANPTSVHARRLDTIGFRLTGILALTCHKTLIDAEVIQAVIQMLDYELRLRTQTDPVDGDNAIAKLEQRIRNVLTSRGGLKLRSLKQLSHANRSGLWMFNQALDNLLRAREVAKTGDVYRLRDETV
jgi:hypothetical protein